MKRKSVLGFVTGLIGTVGAAFISFYVYIIISLATDLAKANDATTTEITLLAIFGMLYLVSVILGIVAVCFYLKKARIGGIIMLIATLCNAALPIYGFTTNMDFSLVLILLPTILFVISTIAGFLSKKQLVLTQPTATQENKKYCINCGKQLNANDGFCPNCGTKQ